MKRNIRTVRDARVNIKPVVISLVHEYFFEGPCRFGTTEEALSTEFDEMVAASSEKKLPQSLQDNIPAELANIMEPICIRRHEDFIILEEWINQMRACASDVDLFWVSGGGVESLLDFYVSSGIKTPVACMKPCCANFGTTAIFRARGVEAYGFATWDEALSTIRALRARKVLRESKILLAPRGDSTRSVTVTEGFLSMEDVTRKFGTRFRYMDAHEVLDATEIIPDDQNHTAPGKHMFNLTEEEIADARNLAEELANGAKECTMSLEMIERSCQAYATVQKLLETFDCTAFTMPCADVCATRRYNEEKFTMCLNHSLNNEQGICSACEYDVPALVSMIMLSSLSDSAPYMGNTSYAPPIIKDGTEVTRFVDAETALGMKEEINAGKVFYTFHSVPNRKLKGFDAEPTEYGITPFAAVQGFGATIRHDFARDKGQVITMARLDPTCSKIVIARGTIIGGMGYHATNCSEGVFFTVNDPESFREGCEWTGIHCPLVYGDAFDEMVKLAKMLGLETYLSA